MVHQNSDPPELSSATQVILFLMSFFGLIFNSMVLYIIQLRKYQSLGPDTVLMALVGIFDVISCFFTLNMQIIRWSIGLTLIGFPRWCWFDLIFFSTSTYASLLITALLSIVRYLVIVRKWRITWKASLLLASSSLIVLWTIVIFRGTLVELSPMPSGLYCMPEQDYSLIKVIIVEVIYGIFLIPLPIFIIIGYILVTRYYYDLVNKGAVAVATQASFGYTPSMIKLISNQFCRSQRSKTIKLLTVILMYAIAIIPEYTLSLLAALIQTTRTSALDCFTFIFMFSLCLINPLFVLCVHEHSNGDFFELFRNLKWR